MSYLLSLLAGMLTALSPCVLPLLPIVLASAFGRNRLAPLALVSGLVLSSGLLGLAIASFGMRSGVDPAVVRNVGSALLIGFGILLLVPRLQDALGTRLSGLTGAASGVADRVADLGLAGQFAAGVVTGLVWSPCTGPTLGAAVGLAAQAGTVARAAVMMMLFSLGAGLPMLTLAYGSRAGIVSRKAAFGRLTARFKPAAGILFALVGMMTLTGVDKRAEAVLVRASPAWLTDLTTRY